MQEISNKKFFINYAFFILILLIVFSLLSYFIIIARKSWNNNLAITVQKVLDEKEADRWKVGEHIEIYKPISVNSSAYKLSDNQDSSEKTVIIIRIVNYYGPISAVYIYNHKDASVDFIGYSSLHGRIQKQLMNTSSDKRKEYWQELIPSILTK